MAAAPPVLAVENGSAAPRMASPASSLGAMVEDDLAISDDSFGTTPSPLTKRMNTKKRDQRSRGGSRKRLAMSLPRSTQPRGMPRPPSPAVERPRQLDHELCAPTSGTPEARLEALERQQKVDHLYFAGIKQALESAYTVSEHHAGKLRQVQQGMAEYREMDVQLRREIYMRGQIEGEVKQAIVNINAKILADLPGIVEQGAGAKLKNLEDQFKVLQGHTNEMSDREKLMGQYLQELHGERPKEGQAVPETFKQFGQEVGRVREMVNKLEQRTTEGNDNVFRGHGEILTKDMLNSLSDMHKKFALIDGMNVRIEQSIRAGIEVGNNCAGLSQRLDTIDQSIIQIESNQVNGAAIEQTCGGAGGGLNLTAAFSGHGACCPPQQPAQLPPGMPAGSAGGSEARMNAIIGGNGICHCVHVKELIERFDEIRAAGQAGAPRAGGDPWAAASAALARDPAVPGLPGRPGPLASTTLPLTFRGPIGAIGFVGKSIFDDKLTMQDEYRFNGVKNGVQWKGKVERYFISKAPMLKELLEWIETEDREDITVERLRLAVGSKLTDEQLMNLNAAIWGFLSGSLTGTAETIFKRSEILNGADAWRRIVRFIDHGRSIRLEHLRREVKTMHLKPIKDIEGVEEGIAEFENTLMEYEQAGGTANTDDEKKSDLLAILPSSLRENLLWQASDGGSFQKFRDMVLNQAAKVILNRKRGQLHNLEDEPLGCSEEDLEGADLSTVDGILAVINRFRRNGKNNFRGRQQEAPRKFNVGQPNGSANQRPRKCANCGKEHPERKCPEPPVAVADRKCWTCNEKGHLGRDCPEKQSKANGIRVVEDAPAPFFGCVMDSEGFTEVRRRGRPTPTVATLGDYVAKGFANKNSYKALRKSDSSTAATPVLESREHGASRLTRQPKPKLQQVKEKTRSIKSVTANELEQMIANELMEAEKTLKHAGEMNLILEEEEELIAAATEEVTIEVAVDSGAVDNVINPDELPCDAQPTGNPTGRHFVGAKGERIEKFGTCDTMLTSQHGRVGCKWQVADVTRPLHSLSKIAGPPEGPGRQDILFTNKKCFVVQPGLVDELMKKAKPVAEYDRQGGLYVAQMKMTSFGRPGAKA